MSTDTRERWFAELVDAGLGEHIFESADLMNHATPEVLAANLPPDVLAKVLEAALSAGALTTDRILETLTPAIVARHIPHTVLWACVASAAKRAGIIETNGEANGEVKSGDKRRRFLRRALERGLETANLSPDDVLRHLTPDILARCLPVELKAKLLAEGLRADKLNPKLVVDVVGVEALASNAPMAVVWECLTEAGERSLGGEVIGAVESVVGSQKAALPTLPAPMARRTTAPMPVQGTTPVKTVKTVPRSSVAAGTVKRKAVAGTGAAFEDDTNVHNEWAAPEDFEVIEESDLGAATPRPVLTPGAARRTDWNHEEPTDTSNVDPPTTRGK